MRNSFEIQPSCARDLISKIHREIPGEKIISITTADHRTQEFDVRCNGEIGFENSHKVILLHRVACAIRFGGEMFVRQFLPLKVERMSGGEKKIVNPEKTLYAIRFSSGDIVAIH